MTVKQPNKIYRYQRFCELTISALCNDQLFFSSPSAFNDPLDCQPMVESNSDIEELRSILRELISRRVEAEVSKSLKHAKLIGDAATTHSRNIAVKASSDELANISYHATNPEYEISLEEAEAFILTQENL